MIKKTTCTLGLLAACLMAAACDDKTPESAETVAQNVAQKTTETEQAPIYATYGTHNSPEHSPCSNPSCIYPQTGDRPENPIYPEYWVSDWTMYRVYKGYDTYAPPYNGTPPAPLLAGEDYEVSYGTTYYDSTWSKSASTPAVGAMMEHYEKKCLPIFPISNDYTCSFISLGDTAFFVTYDDRPDWMPPVCYFSSYNHPPRRDFIKHLPYSKEDSMRMGIPDGQGYSFWVDGTSGKPIQVGVQPDRTADRAIMFGYGFAPQDTGGEQMPQSFYFSGYPLPPANAPIVSQNYTDFRVEKPDPAETWDQVNSLDPNTLPLCQLFDPPQQAYNGMVKGTERAPTWGDIGRQNK